MREMLKLRQRNHISKVQESYPPDVLITFILFYYRSELLESSSSSTEKMFFSSQVNNTIRRSKKLLCWQILAEAGRRAVVTASENCRILPPAPPLQ